MGECMYLDVNCSDFFFFFFIFQDNKSARNKKRAFIKYKGTFVTSDFFSLHPEAYKTFWS